MNGNADLVFPFSADLSGELDCKTKTFNARMSNGKYSVLIDGLVVNGSARVVAWFSALSRLLQTGYIYHYAFVMIIGVLGFLIYFLPFWPAN